MRITEDDFAEAAAWADAQLSGRTPDECWTLLRGLMEVERDGTAAASGRAAELIDQANNEPWRGVALDDVKSRLNREAKEAADRNPRGEMMQCLRLEAVLKRVGPRVARRRWSKGLDPRTDLDRWIHTERLRDAAYPREGVGDAEA